MTAQLLSEPEAQPEPASENVKQGSTATFMKEVVEVSKTTPVIVYFSAPWCGPCKTFGPALERVVTGADGRVRMVKINIDENQQLAQGLRVQSIPAVFVFWRGQPVDGFMGALPESQLQKFIEQAIGLGAGAPDMGPTANPASMLKQAEAFLAEGKADHAAALYQEILAMEPSSSAAHIGAIRSLLALGHKDEARKLFDAAPDATRIDKNWSTVEQLLDLTEKTANVPPSANLKMLVDVTPTDHQTRFDYALSLFAESQKEEAIEQLLEIVRRDRKWNDEAARKELVSIFNALGFNDPLAVEGRKKLSSILFS